MVIWIIYEQTGIKLEGFMSVSACSSHSASGNMNKMFFNLSGATLSCWDMTVVMSKVPTGLDTRQRWAGDVKLTSRDRESNGCVIAGFTWRFATNLYDKTKIYNEKDKSLDVRSAEKKEETVTHNSPNRTNTFSIKYNTTAQGWPYNML